MSEPALSEVERKIIIELCDKADKLFKYWTETEQLIYGKRVQDYLHDKPAVGSFDKKDKWPLRFSMPQEFYQMLKMVKPDGIPFDQNLDFMSFLKRKYPWFTQFELADKDWTEVSGGVSQPGGPLPKAERDRINREAQERLTPVQNDQPIRGNQVMISVNEKSV